MPGTPGTHEYVVLLFRRIVPSSTNRIDPALANTVDPVPNSCTYFGTGAQSSKLPRSWSFRNGNPCRPRYFLFEEQTFCENAFLIRTRSRHSAALAAFVFGSEIQGVALPRISADTSRHHGTEREAWLASWLFTLSDHSLIQRLKTCYCSKKHATACSLPQNVLFCFYST